jgi:4-amino-4-deoxy-L-arabinose transferase-like glycosyltransferase
MSLGQGWLWEPFYSTDFFNPWAEHPPLYFWLESFAFKLLGDHSYTEKLFSLLLGILMAISITRNWPYKNGSWWYPVLLWAIVPTIHWAYSNNMLENLLVLFTSYAVWFGLKKTNLLYASLSGALIFLAFLTKGPVGLFPFAIWILRWLILRELSIFKSIQLSVVALLTFGFLITLLFWQYPASFTFFENYFNTQVLASLNSERLIQDRVEELPRYYLIGRVFTELFNPALLVVLLYIWNSIKSRSIELPIISKQVFLYFVIGLTATLPLLISPKQHSFYLIPAMTWYALALALWSWPKLGTLLTDLNKESKGFRSFTLTIGLLLCLSIYFSATRVAKISRDKDLILFVYEVDSLIPKNEKIGVSADFISHHGLHGYLQRYVRRSLKVTGTSEWRIIKIEDPIPENYTDISLKSKAPYRLLQFQITDTTIERQ